MVQQALKLRIRIQRDGTLILGPGRADLLEFIQSTGSIAAAGRQMGMSYKRAWALVEALNSSFAQPLVEAAKGGPGGGGAKLTMLGREVLAAYQTLENNCGNAAAMQLERLQSALSLPAVSPGGESG